MLDQYWVPVVDNKPVLNQYWDDVHCLLEIYILYICDLVLSVGMGHFWQHPVSSTSFLWVLWTAIHAPDIEKHHNYIPYMFQNSHEIMCR